MASLRKKDGSQYWFACFTGRDGMRHQRSTGEVRRREAQKIANDFEEAARRKRTSRQVRQVILDLHAEITGETLTSYEVGAFFHLWLEGRNGEVDVSTLKFYRQVVDSFLGFLGERRTVDLNEVTERDIMAFRDKLQQDGLAPKTVNHRLKGLRMIFGDAKRRGWIVDDPTEPVGTLKEAAGERRRPFTIEELAAVLGQARATDARLGTEWESLILFGLYTGQRLGDLACLRWNQIDLEANDIAIRTKKTGRRVRIPIAEPLLKWIERLPANDDPDAFVHPRSQDSYQRKNGSGTLSRQFGELLAQAGLRERKAHRKRVASEEGRGRSIESLSFHSLRHSAVSFMKNAGVSPAIVQDLIGHESAEISAHYTHIEHDAKARAVAALPDLTSIAGPAVARGGD